MNDREGIQWSRIARRTRVPLGFAFAIAYFWLAQPRWGSIGAGMLLIVPGLLIRALASGHVEKNETLATSGPYAYTRNPLYLGSLLMGVGFAIAGRSWWVGLLLVVMFFAIYIPVIRDEESFLRGRFPEYEDYARDVPSLFPRWKRRRRSSGTAFSTGLYFKHREYNATLGAAALIAALILKMGWF